ncbi:hypothetical protein C5167_017388 [Papaver somniferum]|uniref:Uncharacterized protein n=1 Tax=Papaver somniferum TaxID=3469 RepID=A0A4Y7IME7_PAPSO|nr:hypothetical protein C5167_017388 [Papaver somniferum]
MEQVEVVADSAKPVGPVKIVDCGEVPENKTDDVVAKKGIPGKQDTVCLVCISTLEKPIMNPFAVFESVDFVQQKK